MEAGSGAPSTIPTMHHAWFIADVLHWRQTNTEAKKAKIPTHEGTKEGQKLQYVT
jgi:hypothetical protein